MYTSGWLHQQSSSKKRLPIKFFSSSYSFFTLAKSKKGISSWLSCLRPNFVEEVLKLVNSTSILEQFYQFKPTNQNIDKVNYTIAILKRHIGLNTYSVTLESRLPTQIRLSLLG